MRKERSDHNEPVIYGYDHAGTDRSRRLAFFFTVFKKIFSVVGIIPSKKIVSIVSFVMAVFICLAVLAGTPGSVLYAQEMVVDDQDVNVRTGPGTDYDVLGTLPYDYTFTPYGLETDEEGRTWYAFSWGDTTGYMLAEYTQHLEPEYDPQSEEAEPDEEPEPEQESETETDEADEIISEELTEYEQVLLETLFAPGSQAAWSGQIQSEEEFENSLWSFPESYRQGLRNVHAVYPNYRFIADEPGMDFQELVKAEQGKKVADVLPESYRAMYDESFGYYENYDWDSGEWKMSEGRFTYASDEVIAYYLDPRNFLNTSEIYMFVRQSYSGNTSVDDLRSFLEGTFLANGYTPNPYDADDVRLAGDYAAVLMEAAQISGVNPFVLATTIFSEQGYTGDSPLAQGYYEANNGKKYISYFNFFNFGATGSDHDNVVVNGMERAKSEGWTSRYKSIVGGAVLYGKNYINNAQDTYYYKNFNVLNGYNSLWHQYATAVNNSYQSGVIMKDVFAGSTYAALEFRIPVYENMPSSAAQLPEKSSSQNNYYFADMQATGLEPAFTMANRDYTMTVTGDTTLKVSVPKWATYEGSSSYAIAPGKTVIRLDVRSQTGYLRSYSVTVTSPVDCTLYVQTGQAERFSITDFFADDGSGRGDANGDGKVSALDYIAIKNHIMQTIPITNQTRLDLADANGDGKVSALDYIAIKTYIMSK